VLARSTNSNIKVWDLQTRSFSRELLLTGGPPGKCFIMSQGNRLIIGSLLRQTVHEVDITTWQEVRTWQGANQLWTGAISPDERWTVTLGGTGASEINGLPKGRAGVGNIAIKGVTGATFSPGGKLLAAASGEGFVRIWDAATLQPIAPDLRGFLQGVGSIAFSPDGQRLVAGSDGKEAIKLWDVDSHEELLILEGQGSMFDVTAFSPDGAVLGSMNGDDAKRSILHLWRAPSWAEIEAAEKVSRRDDRK